MSTSAIDFAPDCTGGPSAYATRAALTGGLSLHIRGSSRLDEVELSRVGASDYLAFRLSAAEARALGSELLAAASAVEASRHATGASA